MSGYHDGGTSSRVSFEVFKPRWMDDDLEIVTMGDRTTIRIAYAEANASNTYAALFNHTDFCTRPLHNGLGRDTKLSRHSASPSKARERLRLRTSMIAEQECMDSAHVLDAVQL